MKIIFLFFFLFLYFPYPAYAATVVINEFLAHPSTGNKEWVEFYNPDAVDLSSYWLDDDINFTSDSGNSNKKSLSNINNTNIQYQYIEFGSFLNTGEDYVVIFSPEGIIVDQYHYTEDPGIDTPMGRSPDGIGSIIALSNATKGSPNSPASPTSTPTIVPTSTHTPTPTKTPIPTPTSKPTATPKLVITATSASTPVPTVKPSFFPTPEIEDSAPTSILGEMITASPSASPTISETKKASFFDLPKLIMGAGVVFVAASGILAFRRFHEKDNFN